MIDKDHRIAVGQQVAHDAAQPLKVRRVQSDRGLVEHIEHAGRPVAHGAGQLHPLPLAGGERRGSAVQCQIVEPQLHQALRCVLEGLTDTLSHRLHLLRQRGGDAVHPLDKLGERLGAYLGERDSAQLRRAGGVGETCAAAVGTDALL